MRLFIQKALLALHVRTGRPMADILHEFVHAVQGVKIPYAGGRPDCLFCQPGEGRVYVNRTDDDGVTIVRYHACRICGMRFQTIEQVDQADRPPASSRKTPDSTTTQPPEVHTQDVGKKKVRKRRK